MTFTTHIRSKSALAVGLFFTAVTAFVLLEDVARHGAPITTKHVMTLAVLAGTIYFGHRFWIELVSVRVGNAFGCALLFLAGTATCVIMSAGRNAEVTMSKAQAVNAANTGRSSAAKDRDEAKARYHAALAAEEAECKSGDGPKCQSRRVLSKLRREDYETAAAALGRQAPEQVANADIKAAAALLARLPLVTMSADAIEALLLILFPFLQSLFCEIGAIVGYSIALARRRVIDVAALEIVAAEPARLAAPAATVSGREMEAVRAALSAGDGPLSNKELAAAMGVSEGEASKRVAALDGAVRKVRVGRKVAISLA